MALKIHHRSDSMLEPLENKRVAVLGYGSQGRAHALNLRDSGVDVVVGLRKDSPSVDLAKADQVGVGDLAEVCSDADVVAMLVPDQHQVSVYQEWVEPSLRSGSTLLFAHGFNVHFGQIKAPADVDVVMVAPKAPGPLVRRAFEQGRGVPALAAVHQDATKLALPTALAYAGAIGCADTGIIESTFAEETETDLFGEQAVLCGGVSRLIQLGFETLTEAGYQPEVAYFECLHELKLIVDLLYEGGFTHMREAISDTAEYGDLTRGDRVIGSEVKTAMVGVLEEITSGAFAREWVTENQTGCALFAARRWAQAHHPIEDVGCRLRAMMPSTLELNEVG